MKLQTFKTSALLLSNHGIAENDGRKLHSYRGAVLGSRAPRPPSHITAHADDIGTDDFMSPRKRRGVMLSTTNSLKGGSPGHARGPSPVPDGPTVELRSRGAVLVIG